MAESKTNQKFKLPGKLFLIPVPLAPNGISALSQRGLELGPKIKYYFVERLKTARRFLKEMDPSVAIDQIQFSEIGQHDAIRFDLLEEWLKAGFEVGIMSEAGCPGVADPGSLLVEKAHELGAQVIPVPGPNSMILALMGAGFSGQAFRFLGYLPIKQPKRKNTIKNMETESGLRAETQIFMETPYRNNQLLKELLELCKESTMIGIAGNLTGENEFMERKTVAEWKRQVPDLHKQPVVFTLFAGKR